MTDKNKWLLEEALERFGGIGEAALPIRFGIIARTEGQRLGRLLSMGIYSMQGSGKSPLSNKDYALAEKLFEEILSQMPICWNGLVEEALQRAFGCWR
ncbi:MAG: hypothetical protein FWG10_01455 [Eubacteriaceae bacterium]|nr:hypothetical protein [Eubacteriaceae bacterium]